MRYFYADADRRTVGPVSDRPPIRLHCAHCSAALAKDAKWCPSCRRSTREHVSGKLASPLKRLAAAALDSLAPAFGTSVIVQFSTNSGVVASNLVRTICIIAWAIWSMTLFSNGMTPGKWVLGLYVIDESGDTASFFRMLFREFVCKPIVSLPFLLGIAWVLFDRENQGWHDKIVNTHVVED